MTQVVWTDDSKLHVSLESNLTAAANQGTQSRYTSNFKHISIRVGRVSNVHVGRGLPPDVGLFQRCTPTSQAGTVRA